MTAKDTAVASKALEKSTRSSLRSWYGGYYLIDSIGRGGMAEVFRAIRPGAEGFQRTVALKRISAAHDEGDGFVQMFCEEARISAMLSHPNIVQVYEFGKAEGTYFLAMEYLRGRDLLTVLRSAHARQEPVPPALVALIGQKVASALAYVHELRGTDGQPLHLVHRDISPANIMLLKQGGVKILDFGIAKSPALARQKTQAGFVKGKLGYLSPEQARCEPLDGRSDLFSLGVTLWEALTGNRLFRGATDYETVKNILNQPVLPPSLQAPWVPETLDRIVMRALERDLEKRYASAKELAADLSEYLRKFPANDDDLVHYLRSLYGGQTSQVIPIVKEEMLARALAAPGPAAVPGEGTSDAAHAALRPTQQHLTHVPPPTPTSLPRMRPAPTLNPPPVIMPAPVAARSRLPWMGAIVLSVMSLSSWHWLRPHLGTQVAQRATAETMEVTLQTEPSGATVEDADGTKLGVTPLTLERAAGQPARVLVLRKAGHVTARVTPPEHADLFMAVPLPTASRP